MLSNQSAIEGTKKQLGKEFLRFQLGPLCLLAAGALAAGTKFYPDVLPLKETKTLIGILAAASIGLTSITLPKIIMLVFDLQEKQNKVDFRQELEILMQPITPELTDAAKRLPGSTLTLKQLPSGNNNGEIVVTSDLPAALLPTDQILEGRIRALAKVAQTLDPSSPQSLTVLESLSELFPYSTNNTGIRLLLHEKNVLMRLFELLQTVPPDKFYSSDMMVDYFSELACVYAQIIRSYLNQIRVNLTPGSESLNLNNLTNRIRAERLKRGTVQMPLVGAVTADDLRKLEEARSLLSGDEAVIMAKQLTAVWFRALPAARTTARELMTQLKNEVWRLLTLRLPKEEIKRLVLMKKIFVLPDYWPQLLSYSENIADPELRELIGRLRKANKTTDFLESFRGKDTTPRGTINEMIKHKGIVVMIDVSNPENSLITIRSVSAYLESAEQVAVCEALLFPGIKKLRIELKGYLPIEVDLAEFYEKRVINGDVGYLRQLLNKPGSSSITTT